MKMIPIKALLAWSLALFATVMPNGRQEDIFTKRLWKIWAGAGSGPLETRKLQAVELYAPLNHDDHPESDLNYEGIPIRQLTLDELPLQEEVDQAFNHPVDHEMQASQELDDAPHFIRQYEVVNDR